MKRYFALLLLLLPISQLSAHEEKELLSCNSCHSGTLENKVWQSNAIENRASVNSSNQQEPLCYMCHEKFTKSNLHAPVEANECALCHAPHALDDYDNRDDNGLLIKNTEYELCAECHDMGMTQKKIKHKPLAKGKCSDCHDPHQSETTSLLKNEKKALCYGCHTLAGMQAEYANIHPPFDDDCANCHETHSAEHAGLLLQPQAQLCDNCHDMQSTFEGAASVHKAVTEGKTCSNCHSAHASKNDKLLVDTGQKLCLSCHNESLESDGQTIANIGKLMKKGNTIHGAIEMDGCQTCHQSHSSEYPKLLNAGYPPEAYTEAKVEKFELCFNCHDSEIITSENTMATNFRNGEKNLHYLHINGSKGRSCSLCHNVHGSASEHLIADMVKFGKWEMPLRYQIQENGGSCNTGCHVEKNYLR